MYYIIYKTTNILNNKFYIGKHQTNNLKDSYIGSGKALVQAIKKYGRENFKFEILFYLNSEEEMNAKEKEIVTEEFVKNPQTYNLTVGGEGGPVFKGKHHSEKTKELLRKNHKDVFLTNDQKEKALLKSKQTRLQKYGCWTSDITKNKISEGKRKSNVQKGKTIKPKRTKEESNKLRAETLLGHIVSQETRDKISAKNKGQIPLNKNTICITNGLINKFIKEEDLTLWENQGWKRGRITSKYKSKSLI